MGGWCVQGAKPDGRGWKQWLLEEQCRKSCQWISGHTPDGPRPGRPGQGLCQPLLRPEPGSASRTGIQLILPFPLLLLRGAVSRAAGCVQSLMLGVVVGQ